VFKQWRLLKVWQPQIKIQWFIYLFLAWDLDTNHEPRLDAGEKIVTSQKTFDEVKKLVLDKAGYLGEANSVFEDINTVGDLLTLPEFTGRTADIIQKC
jgi:hypothetical protein